MEQKWQWIALHDAPFPSSSMSWTGLDIIEWKAIQHDLTFSFFGIHFEIGIYAHVPIACGERLY